MVLTGYPVEDLALRRSFVDASRAALDDLARRLAADGLGDLLVVVGYLDGAPDAVPGARAPRRARRRTPPRCCTAARSSPATPSTTCRTTASFDEFRYFVPGDIADRRAGARRRRRDRHLRGHLAGGGPVAVSREADAGLLLVINGSPYERNKDDVRLELVRRRAREAGCALAYVNLVGGQDELVFDGDSIVVAPDGDRARPGAAVRRELLVVDLDLPAATGPAPDQAARGARRPERHTDRARGLSEQPAAGVRAVAAGRRPAAGRRGRDLRARW